MRLSERYHFIPVMADADISDGATGDSFCMKDYHHCCLLFTSETTNWGAGPDIIVYEGATDGATTHAMTVPYRYASAAVGSANSDVWGAWQTAAAEIAMDADHEGYWYIIEFDASDMTGDYDWITVSVDADASAAGGGFTCTAILTPRYAQDVFPTALA